MFKKILKMKENCQVRVNSFFEHPIVAYTIDFFKKTIAAVICFMAFMYGCYFVIATERLLVIAKGMIGGLVIGVTFFGVIYLLGFICGIYLRHKD